MGIQLNGTSGTDVISAVDGSLTVEGLTISGDFNIAEKIIHTGDTNTFMKFDTDTISFETAGDERLRITSAGIVDVTGKLRVDIASSGGPGSGTAEGIFLRNTTESDNNAVTIFGGADDYNAAASAINFINVDHSANAGAISFDTRSTGNSYAERLRIDANGKIGVGGAPSAWQAATTSKVLQLGNASVFNYNDTYFHLGQNFYWDGSNYKYIANGHSTRLIQNAGEFSFLQAASGSADANITYTTPLKINSSGEVSIGAGAGSGKTLTLYGASSSSFRISKSGVLAYDHTFDGSSYTIANNNGSAGIPIIIGTKTGGGESLRIAANGKVGIGTQIPAGTLEICATSEYQLILKDINNPGPGAEMAIGFKDSANTIQGIVGFNKWEDDEFHIVNQNDGGAITLETNNGGTQRERMRITAEGDIYGPGGGRKNWFDNGSFDCTYGGRKANTSMDYGNHHAYGWVTDRFMSRNSVQWSRSTNVPTGKGFSYSTLTNGAGGQIMQAVELPDYGDMGVFVPGSYWCVSFWSTAGCNPSGSAFSYDLGSTKTDIPVVASGGYATTGETASGTSTGTFSRYYKVFGPMPSSIISGATAAYWLWGFSAAGYTTGFQLERVPTSTSKPTPYEHVHPSVTIARCRRYAYRVYNSRHVCGWKRHDSNVNWEARHPVLPTHMPSGSNQSADPYGVIMHTAGTLTNFQGVWQNPAVSGLYRYGFNPADGSFILYGTSAYSGTHVVIPSYEGFEYEVQHGFF